MVASMAASISGAAAPPVSALTLKPLSVHGLWLAVMTMPAPAPSSRVKNDPTWVGTASGGVKERMSCAASTSTQARAKCSEANRRSWQTMTPRSAPPVCCRYSATPRAQRRTLWKV